MSAIDEVSVSNIAKSKTVIKDLKWNFLQK